MTYNAEAFDVDLFDTPTLTIAALHALGKKSSATSQLGVSRIGVQIKLHSFYLTKVVPWMVGLENGGLTQIHNVRNIMTTRMQLALSKDCDAIDLDNLDGYNNDNGLGLTQTDAINYLSYLSTTAHYLGLACGLNSGKILQQVLTIVDFHINEQCAAYNECKIFQSFIAAGKPVFHIEYPDTAPTVSLVQKSKACDALGSSGFSTILKKLDLSAWIETCQ